MRKQGNRFGAFKGVFTPSILTILGVIMYLRLPWIIGQAGLWATLGIILVAHVISATTGLSVASIATDKKVETGGTYYMISRSLGLPIGGTLGLALFVGLSFSVSLYIIGFSETLLNAFDFEVTLNKIRLTGVITLVSITIITFISTNLALKTQFVILAVLILSLVSIFMGQHDFTPKTPLSGSAVNSLPWIALFAIFFPAVTGFEAGVSMSGDLDNPKKAIPRGTIMAIIVGLVVYIGLVFFFSYTVERDALLNDSAVLFNISFYSPLVIAGIWGATLSSAFGSILGAPRILQATAMDRITPRIFAKGVGAGNEPRNAILLTFVIALAGILIGELNAIARVVSIFFIITYGFLNLTCAIENWAGSDFRPSFRIPAWVSIIGAIACFVVMIQLDFIAMVGATILLGAIFIYLKRKELTLQSGDTWAGFWSSIIKYGLLKLSSHDTTNQRNWRPNIILFSGKAKERPHLIEMGRTLVGKQGVFTNFELVENSEGKVLFEKTATTVVEKDSTGKEVKTRRHTCRDIYEGILTISQVYGFTGFDPNTVLMGWGKRTRNPDKFYETTIALHKLNYNLIFFNQIKKVESQKTKQIDFWWSGNSRNFNFGVALLKYITSDPAWRRAHVRINIINYNSAKTDSIYAIASQVIENSRLFGTVNVINNAVEKISEVDIIKGESTNSDLSILELNLSKHKNISDWAAYVNEIVDIPCSSLIIEAGNSFEHINANTTPYEVSVEKSMANEASQPLLETVKLPEKELLAEVVYKTIQKNEELQRNFITNSIISAETLLVGLQKEVESLTRKVFKSVQGCIDDPESQDMRTQVNKSLSDFSFQTKNKLSRFNEDVIRDIHESMSHALDVYLNNVHDFNSKLPDKLIVKFSKPEFKSRKNDSFRIKLFKLRSRLRGMLFGWPINRKVEMSKAADLFLYANRLEPIGDYYEQFGLATFKYVSNLRRCLVDMGKGIEQIIVDQENSSFKKDLDDLKVRTTQLLAEIVNNLELSNREITNTLNSDLKQSLQRLSFVVGKSESEYLISPYKKLLHKRGHGKKDVHLAPEIWLKNIRLFANKSILEFTLISLKQRFKIKLKKHVNEISLWVDGKTNETIGEVKSLLQELKTLSEVPDSSNIFQSLSELKNSAMQDRFEVFFKDVNDILSELPEVVEVNDDSFFSEVEEGKFPESEVRKIDLRSKAQFYIGTELISNARKSSDELSHTLKDVSTKVADKLRLAIFNIDNIISSEETTESSQQRENLVDELMNDIAVYELQIKKAYEQFEDNLYQFLNHSLEPLHQLVFSKQPDTKKSSTKHRIAPIRFVGKALRPFSNFFNKQLVNILYSQSEGIMLAQRITNFEKEHKISNQAIQEMLVSLAGSTEVKKNIPFYYQSLFSGSTALSKDLWVTRSAEQKEAKRITDRFKSGYTGALLITGNRNSGKSTLSKYIANTYLPKFEHHSLKAPKGGSSNKKDFMDALQKALKIQVDPYYYLQSSMQQRVIIINDLELWWERHPDGFEVMNELIRMIDTFSGKVFFIVNCGTLAYGLISRFLNFDAYFMGQIECEPFDAKELKDIVLFRHTTGGLKLSYNGKGENALTEWNYAHLFNKYFNLSDGNPGYTLQAWLSNITKVVGKTIYIKTPSIPNLSHLNNVSEDLWLVLLQLALHRRISAQRLSKVLHQSESQIATLLKDMQRAGLVEERFTGVFAINGMLEPHIVKKMKEKGFC